MIGGITSDPTFLSIFLWSCVVIIIGTVFIFLLLIDKLNGKKKK